MLLNSPFGSRIVQLANVKVQLRNTTGMRTYSKSLHAGLARFIRINISAFVKAVRTHSGCIFQFYGELRVILGELSGLLLGNTVGNNFFPRELLIAVH